MNTHPQTDFASEDEAGNLLEFSEWAPLKLPDETNRLEDEHSQCVNHLAHLNVFTVVTVEDVDAADGSKAPRRVNVAGDKLKEQDCSVLCALANELET